MRDNHLSHVSQTSSCAANIKKNSIGVIAMQCRHQYMECVVLVTCPDLPIERWHGLSRSIHGLNSNGAAGHGVSESIVREPQYKGMLKP